MVYKNQRISKSWRQISRALVPILLVFAGAASASARDLGEKTPPASPQAAPGAPGTADNHEQTAILQHRNRRYQLHSADVLTLEFPFTPEFNQTVTVQPDGYVTLRGVDNMHVQGLTLP